MGETTKYFTVQNLHATLRKGSKILQRKRAESVLSYAHALMASVFQDQQSPWLLGYVPMDLSEHRILQNPVVQKSGSSWSKSNYLHHTKGFSKHRTVGFAEFQGPNDKNFAVTSMLHIFFHLLQGYRLISQYLQSDCKEIYHCFKIVCWSQKQATYVHKVRRRNKLKHLIAGQVSIPGDVFFLGFLQSSSMVCCL